MTNDQIFAMIDEERDAQDLKWGPDHDDTHSLEEWAYYMRLRLCRVKTLHKRKLVVAAAMAMAVAESHDRRAVGRYSRKAIFREATVWLEQYVPSTIGHKDHAAIIDSLDARIKKARGETWEAFRAEMIKLIAEVVQYLRQECGFVIYDGSDRFTANILVKRTETLHNVKLAFDNPVLTLSFKKVGDAAEALTAIGSIPFKLS